MSRLPSLLRHAGLLTLLLLPMTLHAAAAQDADAPKEEFRAAWIATVLRLDWPRTTTPAAQQAELVTLLDDLQQTGINAVFFQVRPEADALYDSALEPWSVWLTGRQGQPPAPYWDPLAFAVEEAHRRGMELHAWFNPFRAARDADAPVADDHVTVTRPEWILTIGDLKILDPGLPDVRDYIADVVMDVVTRYDVDGVHFDDYFYPYPPDEIGTEDEATYLAYRRDERQSVADWRRANINAFVEGVFERILAYETETGRVVKYGISPFGIWRSGVPGGIVGLSAYDVIYADAPVWMRQSWLDYLTPQLYWPFGGGQDYGLLAPWWATQANGRHLYPGHGLYRADRSTFSGTLFSAREIPNQVRFNRQTEGIQGSVFFRAANLTRFSSRGFADTLRTDLYRRPALTPSMWWKNPATPASPQTLAAAVGGDGRVTLSWTPPPEMEGAEPARRYAVYRVVGAEAPDPQAAAQDARNLLAVTGETTVTDVPEAGDVPTHYFVTAVSANSIESTASNVVTVEGRAVATAPEAVSAPFRLDPNHPNPFTTDTELTFSLDQPGAVSLVVYSALGQEVRRLLDGAALPSGGHAVRWDGTDAAGRPVASGLYLVVLTDGRQRQTQTLTRVR